MYCEVHHHGKIIAVNIGGQKDVRNSWQIITHFGKGTNEQFIGLVAGKIEQKKILS